MKISVDYNNDSSLILPRITQAKFAGNYSVLLTFSDGEVKKVNFGGFLKKSQHPAIRSYLDEQKFKNFKIENGNIVWGENWDLIFSIEQLYRGKID
jgi:hypothetical protein